MIIRHYKLPKKKFLCKVPLISTYEPEMLELIGLPQAIDNQGNQFDIYNNMTMVMIDIDRMIELYKTGYRIAVLKKSDVTEIYNILERYYYDVEEDMNYSLNRKAVREDRLDDINNFIDEILKLNKVKIVKDHLRIQGNMSGFTLDYDPMSYGNNNVTKEPVIEFVNGYDTKSQRTGILSGYETDLSPTALNASSLSSDTTYINNNLPVININKVERRKTYKLGE